MENLNEPTPYDHIQNLHCNSEIVPDLLVFNHRQVNMKLYFQDLDQGSEPYQKVFSFLKIMCILSMFMH